MFWRKLVILITKPSGCCNSLSSRWKVSGAGSIEFLRMPIDVRRRVNQGLRNDDRESRPGRVFVTVTAIPQDIVCERYDVVRLTAREFDWLSIKRRWPIVYNIEHRFLGLLAHRDLSPGDSRFAGRLR